MNHDYDSKDHNRHTTLSQSVRTGCSTDFQSLHGRTACPVKTMISVKPLKSKNRDKIDLDAPNPNLKKGCDRDFFATA